MDPDIHDWLSTGQVAALLGVSRQHVVDLCKAGLLQYSLVGRHRRIRRSDVELMSVGSSRTTRDQSRSLLLGHAIASHLIRDPDKTRSKARANLEQMRMSSTRHSAERWLDEWERLLDGPLVPLLTTLTSPSPRARELRQNSPFAGVLSESERQQVLELAKSAGYR